MFRSIRWHLPFTYALIAFLTVALLGALLLTHLRSYYAAQELSYLRDNAMAISQFTGFALKTNRPTEDLQMLVNRFTFLAQVRVRVLSADQQQVIVESNTFSVGSPAQIQWMAAAEGQGLPSDRFNITVLGSETVPACPSDQSQPCDLMINKDEIAFTESSEATQGTFVMSAMPSPYGWELGRRMMVVNSLRSEQVIEQVIYDPSTQSVLGWVILSEGPAYGSEVVNGVTSSFILAGAAAVTLAAAAGWGISRSMSTPLRALAQSTERMASGDLSARVSIARQDEIGTLANGFNGMAARVEEMVSTLRRFIADAAHELNTPLTALHTNLELVAAEDISAHSREIVVRAQTQLKRLEMLTKGLLHLSRLESGSLRENITPVNLTTFTHETAATFASQAEQAGVTLDIQIPNKVLTLTADESQLQSALGNLLDNAIKFTPEGGTVSVHLAHVEQWAEIRVRDTGIGIRSEDLPFLFERFYRGHNVSDYPGSGLGLSIVHAIAEHYGGKIQVLPMTQGTEFSLRLPVRAS